MATAIGVYTTNTLIHTGMGLFTGVVITSNAGAIRATFYDNTVGSGKAIFDAYVDSDNPLVVFFPDAYAPRFSTGLYISLADGLLATVWTKKL